VTGPTRDLDVFLIRLAKYCDGLPGDDPSVLEPFAEFLRGRQRREHAKVVKALDSARYKKLVETWRAFLREAPRSSSEPANANRVVREVAAERIRRVFRGVVKRGRAAGGAGTAEAYHDLRIRCKKLRYLLEFFRSLFDTKLTGQLVSELKLFQGHLGDYNDCQVQRELIERYAGEMRTAGAARTETILAMGRLTAKLETRQRKVRQSFSERFSRFASAQNKQRLEQLLAAGEQR